MTTRVRLVGVIACAVLLCAACGSRRTQAEIAADNLGAGGAAASQAQLAGAAGSTPTDTDAGTAGGVVADSAAGPSSAAAAGAAGSGGTTADDASAEAGSGAQPAAAAGSGAPLRIGSVSTLSGPAGAAQAPGVEALRVWVRWINDRGGVNGHLVELSVADDAGDPARHLALVRDMAENQGVIAFVSQWASQTHQGAAAYLAERRVPVIGGEGTHRAFWENPMYFPQSAHFETGFAGAVATAARFVEGREFGTLVCRESQICEDAGSAYARLAPEQGFRVTYEGQGSLAQPDFTAECLAARNAGVDVLATIFDANSVKRVARSCAAQGFHPKFFVGHGISDAGTAEMPEFEGSIGAASVFPFVFSGSPAAREFHDAFARYAPDTDLAQAHAVGWVAAKLFELVAGSVGDEPSSEQLLEALWSLQGEDLGGLTGPMTFTRDAPAAAGRCYFPLRIEGGAFVAPDGGTPTCL